MLAALLGTQRGLMIITALTMLLVAAVGGSEWAPLRLVGFVSLGANRSLITVGTFILSNVVLAVFLQRFSRSLREALATALNRQHELEAYRDHLEELVSVRTAELTVANGELHRLAHQLAERILPFVERRKLIELLNITVVLRVEHAEKYIGINWYGAGHRLRLGHQDCRIF